MANRIPEKGWEKTEKAVSILIAEMEARRIKIDRELALASVLGALRELKDSFGEGWAGKDADALPENFGGDE